MGSMEKKIASLEYLYEMEIFDQEERDACVQMIKEIDKRRRNNKEQLNEDENQTAADSQVKLEKETQQCVYEPGKIQARADYIGSAIKMNERQFFFQLENKEDCEVELKAMNLSVDGYLVDMDTSIVKAQAKERAEGRVTVYLEDITSFGYNNIHDLHTVEILFSVKCYKDEKQVTVDLTKKIKIQA